MNILKKMVFVIGALLIIMPINSYSANKYKNMTCKQIFADWKTSDPKLISKRAGVSLAMAKELVKNGSQLVAPEGCVILIEGTKGKPHCNGKPLTKKSCRPQ